MDRIGPHSASGLALRSLRDAFRARGMDFEAFLRGFHISPEDLNDISKRYDTFVVSAIWEEARELLSRPFLHVEMERELSFGSYGALEFFVISSNTVKDAIVAITNYADLWNTLLKISVQKNVRDVEVSFSSSDPLYDLNDLIVEMAMATVIRRVGEQVSMPFKLSALEFAHPKTARLLDYEQSFGVTPEFECKQNCFRVSFETWNMPLKGANPPLHDHLGLYLEEMGRRFRGSHSDIIGRVRHYVFSSLGSNDISINDASKFLGLSPRSLQRALKDTDTTFSEVIDDVKKSFALKWVQESNLDLSEIAARLGFNDQSAFVKAYKRWTDTTPGEDRRRNLIDN